MRIISSFLEIYRRQLAGGRREKWRAARRRGEKPASAQQLHGIAGENGRAIVK